MRFLKYWLPVILWMGFIFAMSTHLGSSENSSAILEPIVHWVKPDTTPEQFELVQFIVRKLGHLSEYAVLALLLFRALRNTLPAKLADSPWQTAGITLLITATYASTDEFHQTFVPGRTPTVGDVMIDSSGALVALLVVLFWCYVLAPSQRQTTEKS